MGKNRIFFPQDSLNQWVDEGRIDLYGSELVIRAENRRYRVVEALRVLSEVSGAADLYELVGKVKSLSFLVELGAEVLGTSMVVGDNAYEVIPGFMGTALERPSVESAKRDGQEQATARSEEALLAEYLLRTLE